MTRLISILILTLLSCSSKKSDNAEAIKKFKSPSIIQTKKTPIVSYFKTENITEVFPQFIGQFKFTDSIHFIGKSGKRDSVSEQQYRWEQNAFDLDTLSSDGLQILTDYATSIAYTPEFSPSAEHYFYPVYIVNETTEPKIFIGKDSYVFAIQEAVDTSDFFAWYAIEGRALDFCGNGFYRRRIQPGEFVMFLFPKYQGTEETLLRARVKIGDNIFISKPFKGTINRNQFNLKKGSFLYDNLKETKDASISSLFYGATPKNVDKL